MQDQSGHDEPERDAVERLRDADPAAGVEPRAGFADEVVAMATDEQPDASAPVADLAGERARRRRRWLPVAAAAAAATIVAGAVGYGIGAANAGSGVTASRTSPANQTMEDGAVGAARDASGSPVPITPDLGGSKFAADSMPWGGNGNSFHAAGLDTAEGTAAAYTYDARAVSNAESVGAVAAALGVEGVPELRDGAWVVGPQDGSGPSVTVGLSGTMAFSYVNPALDPWSCDDPNGCTSTGTQPDEAAAVDALRALVAGAGFDPADFEYTSETWEGAVTRMAQAWPMLDGHRFDQSWYLELTDEGVYSASGNLAPIVPLGDYPVVSAQAAFERLSDPRFGARISGGPVPLAEDAMVDVADAPVEWVPPTEPPTTPQPGAPVSWPVNDVEIVAAELMPSTQWQPDGSVIIAPSYRFTDADGGTWSVIAIADSHLDLSTK
ncbi:hypothetical protein GE115_13885 [Agromyces sp. CFH 90414]|uniref:Uncharacterized protein n=1 Tax=Agromyces agglutinans TaxID=2662258 RepID=A0A6I2FAU1_9MICO|nr:hypothetical protein [Agromyces agglutinans]MRG60947.1 hypothetical protein [Agromyces agglutinans]